MIKHEQLYGRFSQADVDVMNAAIDEAIFYFDIESADLNERERLDVIEMLETNVIANFFKGKLLWEIKDLLPEAYQRFLTTRTRR